ncbi:MAG: zinc dependent phospholipase C family protein [Nanoarchaeota archaeon]|nr:zinc dependent phospholipase C family protein [Nanoarchaeota archaeon]MBU4352167.1 zinc dependent phospholipase C family protein [Nanoarchaeota archaeon]
METETHVRIAQKSIELANNKIISEYDSIILKGCFNEDFWSIFNFKIGIPVLTHFYSPIKHKGFWFFKNAKKKALKLFNKSIKLYKLGKKKKSFYELGRSIHLLSDLATPAHTKLIRHYFQKDALEHYAEQVKLPVFDFIRINKEKVEDFFEEIANLSYKFGVLKVKDLKDKNKFNLIENQHKALITNAIISTTSLLLFFIDEIKE